MKILKYVIIAVLLVLVMGCSKEELPEGYTVVCSFEGDKYSLRFPDGRISANIWSSERKVIHYAMYWEGKYDEDYIAPSDKYEWDECK